MARVRPRQELTIEEVWDLEDEFTPLAGSATGVRLVVKEVASVASERIEKSHGTSKTRKAQDVGGRLATAKKLTNEKVTGIYVERRPAGDYAERRPDSERASAVEPSQKQAIEKSREMAANAPVPAERVRETRKGARNK